MKREELLNSKEYWLSKIQIDLFNEVEKYMQRNGLNRTQLAEKLGVSKGYISQILNGDAYHRISKLVELSLAIGMAPRLSYENLDLLVKADSMGAVINSYKEIENSQRAQNKPPRMNVLQINEILKINKNNGDDCLSDKPSSECLTA